MGRAVNFNLKVYAGIAVAIGSQFVAALLEYARRSAEVLPIGSECAPLLPDGEHVRMSALSGGNVSHAHPGFLWGLPRPWAP